MIDLPQKRISMSPCLVTQKEYSEFMSNNSVFRGDDLPVESVTWKEALEFCNAKSVKEGLTPYYNFHKTGRITRCSKSKGYRLPTRAEWLHAARFNNKRYAFSGGNDLGNLAWYWDNSGGTTHEVGFKKPNALGLYDMCGNVSEWMWDGDEYGKKYILGGGWSDPSMMCRLPCNRRTHYAHVPSTMVGFRIVKNL